MKSYFDVLYQCPLFEGLDNKELHALFTCLSVKERNMQKDELLLAAGDPPEQIGAVLSGRVYVVQEDYWGERKILASIEEGGIFGEAFACAQAETLPVSVIARQPGRILLFDCEKMLTPCASSCGFHTVLIRNMMRILANKNIALTRKMEHITKKTAREKVLSYLSEYAVLEGKAVFEIPFNRQEMADYLSIERSALSSTLGKMRNEGIIDFYKNKFRIL